MISSAFGAGRPPEKLAVVLVGQPVDLVALGHRQGRIPSGGTVGFVDGLTLVDFVGG
jgi:hypothetical protein